MILSLAAIAGFLMGNAGDCRANPPGGPIDNYIFRCEPLPEEWDNSVEMDITVGEVLNSLAFLPQWTRLDNNRYKVKSIISIIQIFPFMSKALDEKTLKICALGFLCSGNTARMVYYKEAGSYGVTGTDAAFECQNILSSIESQKEFSLEHNNSDKQWGE